MTMINLPSLSTDISEKVERKKEIVVSIAKKRENLFIWTYRPNNLTFNQSVATSVRLRREKSVLR